MAGVFRAKALSGGVLNVGVTSISLANGGSLFLGILTGDEPLILESIAFLGDYDVIGGLHEDEPFTLGDVVTPQNLDATSSNDMLAVFTDDVTPDNVLVAEDAKFVGSVRNNTAGTAPIILKPSTSYIVQITNKSGTVKDATLNLSVSEKR